MNSFTLFQYLKKHETWSRATFGEGRRTTGLLKHIRSELEEIEKNPTDLMEWIDVIILAFDGCWRAGYNPVQVIKALWEKQEINEAREYPMVPEDEPSFHVESQ